MNKENMVIDFNAERLAREIGLNENPMTPALTKRKKAISKLPQYRGDVQSKNTIRQLPEVETGQIFWVNMDNMAYVVAEKNGKKMTIKALDETATISTGMTIYDMNKSIISKEPLFDWTNEKEVTALKSQVKHWFLQDTKDKYFLFYGREMHYISLMHVLDDFGDKGFQILKESIESIGDLISMDCAASDGQNINSANIEVWIRTETNPAELLYLFPYDKGLITI